MVLLLTLGLYYLIKWQKIKKRHDAKIIKTQCLKDLLLVMLDAL